MKGKFFKKSKLGFTGMVAIVVALIASFVISTFSSKTTDMQSAKTRKDNAWTNQSYSITGDELVEAAINLMIRKGGYGLDCSGFVRQAMLDAGFVFTSDGEAWSPMSWNSEWVKFTDGDDSTVHRPTLIAQGYEVNEKWYNKVDIDMSAVQPGTIVSGTADPAGRGNGHCFIYIGEFDTVADLKQAIQDKYGITVSDDYILNSGTQDKYWYIEGNGSNNRITIRNYGWEHTYQGAKNLTFTKLWQVTAYPSGSYNMKIAKRSQNNPSSSSLAGAEFKISQQINNSQTEKYYFSGTNTKSLSDSERFTTSSSTYDNVVDNVEIDSADCGQFDYYTICETNPPAGYAFGGNGSWTLGIEVHKDLIDVEEGTLGIDKLVLVANTQGDYNGYEILRDETVWFDEDLNQTTNPTDVVLMVGLDENGTEFSFVWCDPTDEGKYNIDLLKTDKETESILTGTYFDITKQIGASGTVENIYNRSYQDEGETYQDWVTQNPYGATPVVSNVTIDSTGVDTYTFEESNAVSGYGKIGGNSPLELKVYKRQNPGTQKYEIDYIEVNGTRVNPSSYALFDENLENNGDVTLDNCAVIVSLGSDRASIGLEWRDVPLSGEYQIFFGKKSSEDLNGPYISGIEYHMTSTLDIMNRECYDYDTGETYNTREYRTSRSAINVETQSSLLNVTQTIWNKQSQEILNAIDYLGLDAVDNYAFDETDSCFAQGFKKNHSLLISVHKKKSIDQKRYELSYVEYMILGNNTYSVPVQKGQKLWVLEDRTAKLDNEVTAEEKSTAQGYIELSQNGEITVVGLDRPIKGSYNLKIKKVNASNNDAPLSDIKFEVDSTVANCLDQDGRTAATDGTGLTNVSQNIQITKNNVDTVDSYTITEVITSNNNLVTLSEPITLNVTKNISQSDFTYKPTSIAFQGGESGTTVTETATLEDGSEVTVKASISGDTVTIEIPNKVKGEYELKIGKKSLQDIDDGLTSSFVPAVKFDVDQYLNVDPTTTTPTGNTEIVTMGVGADTIEIPVGEEKVTINDVTKNDKYVITEDTVPFFLIKSTTKYEVEVIKAYDSNNLKYYVSDLTLKAFNGDTELTTSVTTAIDGNLTVYRLKDENDQIIFIAYLDKNNETITFIYGNEIKEGEYNFVLTKTDYEKQIIEDENTKFDVTVYSEMTENTLNNQVSFDNQVTLVNKYNQTITTTNLTAPTGKTTGMNGINIGKDDIGKTYYFVVEETDAPDKYTAIDYLVVVPISFEAKDDKYEAKQGEAFAIIETETPGVYTKKALSELKTDDNEVAELDAPQNGITINLNVPNKPMEGKYNFVVTKVDYEKEIIDSETTVFDVNVFATKSENGSSVTFSNPVTLYKSTDKAQEDVITTTNLHTTTGKTTGMNGIAIQPEDIGKTYYFIVEETVAPDKYTEIEYLVAVPVSFSIENGVFVATQGNAFALIPAAAAGTYTKKELSELKTPENEVAELDDQIGMTINLNVPDKRITGDYKIKVRKVNSVTNNPIDGVVFSGKDRNNNDFSVTTGHVDGQNGVAVIAEEHYDDLIENAQYLITEYELPQAMEGDFIHLTDYDIRVNVSTKLSNDGKEYAIDTVTVTPVKTQESETFERQRALVDKITKNIDETNQVITITIPNEPTVDYSLKLKKVDTNNNPLNGSEFTIYENGNIILGTSKTQGAPLNNLGEYLVSKENQQINSTYKYKIYETKAPIGYENIFEKVYIEVTIRVDTNGNITGSYNLYHDPEIGGTIADLVKLNKRLFELNLTNQLLVDNGNGNFELDIPNPIGITDVMFTLTKHEKNSQNGVEGATFNIGKIEVQKENNADIDAIISRFDNNDVDSSGVITTTFENSRNLLIDSQSNMTIGDSYYYQIEESYVPSAYESKFKKAIVRVHANSDQTITSEIVAVKLTDSSDWDKNFSDDDALILSQNGNNINLSWENVDSFSIEVIKRKYNNEEYQDVDGDLDRLNTLSGATFTVKRVDPDTKEQIGDTIYDEEVMGDTFNIDNNEANASTTYCYEIVEDASVEGYTNLFEGAKIYVYIVTDTSGLINSSNTRIEISGTMSQQKKKYLEDRCSIAVGRSRTQATVNIANEQRTLSLELMKVADSSAQINPDELVGIPGIEFSITEGSSQSSQTTDSNGYIFVDNIAPDSGVVEYEFEEVSVPQGVTILTDVNIKVSIDTTGMTTPEDITSDRITVDVTKNGAAVTDLDVQADIVGTTIVLKVPNKTTSMIVTLLKTNDEGTPVAGGNFTVRETTNGTSNVLFDGVTNGIFATGKLVEANTTYEYTITENDPPKPFINALQGYDLIVHLETDAQGKLKGTTPDPAGYSYLSLNARSGETPIYTTNELLDDYLKLTVTSREDNDSVSSSVGIRVIDPYSYKVQINKKNATGDINVDKAKITAELVNDANPGTIYYATEGATPDLNVLKQELKNVVDSTDTSNTVTLNRQYSAISEQIVIGYNIGMAPDNDTAQIWRITEDEVDGPYVNILGNNTLIVPVMYKYGKMQLINHHDYSAQASMNFYVVDPDGNNVTGDYVDYINIDKINVNGFETINVTIKDPAKMYLDLIKVKYDPDSRDVSNNERLEGAVIEAKSAATEQIVARIDNGASQSGEIVETLNVGDRRTYYISEISTPRGYINVFENITIELEVGLGTDELPKVYDIKFKKQDGTYASSDENVELLKYITFMFGWKDREYPFLHIYIQNPEENPSSFNFELIKKDKDTNERMNGVEFSLTVFDENNQEVTLKDVNTEESINTESITTQTVNGIDGVISIHDILIEHEGTYTFVLHEKEIHDSNVLYKSFAEDIKVKVVIVYENNKYIVRSTQIVQGNQYVEFLTVSEDEQQTISAGILNERIKGSFKIVIDKVDSYDETKKLDGAKFDVSPYNSRGQRIYLYSSVDGSKINTFELQSTNGTVEIDNINIDKPRTIKFEVEETIAPTGYQRFLDTIEFEVTTNVEGENDNARYVVTDAHLVSDHNGEVTFDANTNTIHLVIKDKYFDLALRKSIESVQYADGSDDGKITAEDTADRVPIADSSKIDTVVDDELVTTADYKHVKNHVRSFVGQEVIYTLRVYNEGEIDGYAEEVVDHLPEGLEFVNDDFNASNGWEYVDGDSTLRTVRTTILSKEKDEDGNLIKARDKVTGELDYKEIKIKCRVKEDVTPGTVLTNIAEITRRVASGYTESTTVDRDNTASAVIPDTKEGMANYKEDELTDNRNDYVPGQEDDDDFEKLIVEVFDLALRKYIIAVNDVELLNTQGDDCTYEREPRVNADALKDGSDTTAEYTHTKEPVEVAVGDVVTYTIEVFNEGSISGYATLIKDDIPEGLQFIPDNSINTEYNWEMVDENDNVVSDPAQAKYVVSDYLADESKLIEAFDNTLNKPHSQYVKIAFKVVCEEGYTKILTNEAQIADDADENGNAVKDRDSTPNKWLEEDDEDVEHVKVVYMDLALRKFITGVTDFSTGETKNIESRKPDVDVSILDTMVNGKLVTTAEYEHIKDPVLVHTNDTVIYTIRVYNEGSMDGYATQIKDDIPAGLEYLPDHEINNEYEWYLVDADDNRVTDISKATYIVTDYRSIEKESPGRLNLIAKFNKETMTEPDYVDVKIAFKVIEPTTSDRILINEAQISKQTDSNGTARKDRDSTPNKWLDEDDEDIEKVRVLYFDLALRKWVTKAIVTIDGKTTVTNTGHKAEDDPEDVVKVDLKKSKVDSVVVKFEYQIRITNEGEIAGWADEVKDYIPEGLRFDPADNPTWKQTEDEKVVVTDELKGTLLEPGESAEVTIVLTWINSADNMGLKVNVAEISKDRNRYNTKDIDSTPNNKKAGEDDIDDAPVMLSIKTGAQTAGYIAIATAVITILAFGVSLIKKYTGENK